MCSVVYLAHYLLAAMPNQTTDTGPYSFLQSYTVTLAARAMITPVTAVSGLVKVVVLLARTHVLEPRVQGNLPDTELPDVTDPAIKNAWLLLSEPPRITSSVTPQQAHIELLCSSHKPPDKRQIWRGTGLAKDLAPRYTFISESRSNEVGPKLIRVSCNV
ncbi:hypothetical protein BM1_02727 [Bipolaris maydis]|nr:hypothetical protein BM1_02727 [Bipolaris maydis]